MPGGVTGSDTLTCSSGRAPGKERGWAEGQPGEAILCIRWNWVLVHRM